MGQYRIKSEPLGVDFMVNGDQAPNAKSTFQILKQVVSPDKMIKAYEGGHKQLAREAFKNGYFDQEQDSDLYDVFKQAAGEVLEGLEGISKEVSLDFAASGMMTYGVPGSQQMVEAAREEQQKRRKQRKATGYQLAAEVFAGYKTIGDAGKLGFSKLVGEGDEDIDASIEFIKGMMETEAFLNDGASIMAEQFGDIDMYNDLKAGRVSPDKQQALAGSLFVQLENPLAMASTGAVRSTSNMLRRGTAKKLAEQLQNAEAKKLLYSQQLNRLSANAPDNVVQSATDALKGATKEADEILEKLKPYTEQKAKAGAGITNKAIGKTMQGLGKAGEYVGNMTEFLRRAGIEEATTFLMRTGLSESAAKAVVFGTVGAGLDATDGEMSLGGSGLNALAAYMGPRALATMGRSTAILGKQLTIAESSLPFFKRVGALPADNPKLSEVIVDRTENLVLGDATSQLKPILTQSREIPSLVRGTARVLDRSGVGRVLTEGANLTKATVAGASIPGAFGYMAGGEEGAASAIGASAPFIAAGLGYGSLLRFSSNSDLIAKQLGDLEYHKQSMTEPELREFNKLKKDQQIAISTFSQFFPDVVIRVKSMGRDGPNGAQYVDGKDSVVEINSDSDNPLGVVLAHEIGHHIERHGLLPNILEELIGNAEKGRVGLFTKIDEKTGKPIVQTDANGLKFYELNQEFRDLQQAYIEKLERTNVSDKDRLRYETPEHFAREIFAEIVAERMISGKTAKRARQSSTYKMIESLGERITSGGFKRKVMHSLGMATNKDGSIVKGTGVLNKAFRSSRELDNLVKRYEDETIGLSESEIREQRPVVGDDELDTVIVSPNDPIESLQAFNNGGHFKTNEDGSIKINPITRKPEVFTPAETRQANLALARDLIEAIQARENDLPEGHVTLSETADGKLVGSGKFIDDSIIDELAKTGRYNASQISYLREASRAGREGQGNHMLLFYYAATGKGGRKYKTLKGGYRDSLVYGVTITKDGNVIFDTVSLDKLQKNVDYLLKRRGKEIAQAFGGSDDATVRQNFESMFEKYLDNHAKGIINGDSNPESGITDKQRDFLNAAFGPVSKSQIADNPALSNLGERRANTLATYRSRRLDRIGTIQPTGNTRNVVIDRLRRNLMPGRGEGDKLFMPASEAGAGKGKQAEAAKLWQEKGTDSPYFKKWFGKSKVVDENGEPLVVKHGLASGELVDNFFDPDKLGRNTKAASAMEGFFFSRGKTSESYGLKTLDYDSAKDLDYNVYSELLNTKEIFESLTGESFDDKIPGTFSSFDEGVLDPSSYFETGLSNNSPEDYVVDLQSKLKNTINDLEWESGSFQDDIKNQLEQEADRLRKNVLEPLEEVDDMAAANVAQVEAYLSLQDPLIVDQKGKEYRETTYYDTIVQAKRDRRDGVIIKNTYDGGPLDDIYIAFKPEQIKSATANRGTFDAGERNILFMPGKGTSALDILKSNQKPEGLPKVPTILEIAEYFKKEFGNPIDYKKSTPEQNRLFEDLIYEEVLYAQELHPEAAGWYDENLSLALSVLEELDPTIKQPDNNFIFKSVLAATSDGNKVQPQFDQTWATYNHWKDTGEISGKFVGGDRISNIKNNLLRIEAIFQLMGGEGAGRWLSQKGTIGEIRKAAQDDLGYTKAEASKIGTSELVDEVVPYAVILGPKLGSFFNNLYGDYSTFTMDRWFMRTVGRNTGTQVVPIPPAKLNAAKQRVRDAVNSLTPAERKKIGITKQSVAGNNAIKASTKLAGYFAKKQNRTGVSAEVDNLRRAANALNKFGKPLKEAPQNGAERRWLRERLETVQSRLRDVGVNLENADLQALLWYNEKEIYEKLGYRSPTGSADYAGAAEALHARKAGKPSRSYAEGTGRVGEIGRSTGESVLGKTSPQEVNFLPAGNFSRQPANRITRQAPAMPGNRFMLPAVSAGAKSAERFR
jgi:hypothetical protein